MKLDELKKDEDYVVCDECGHIVTKASAQFIEVLYSPIPEDKKIYCLQHRKPYDYVEIRYFSPNAYIKKMYVDKDGTPIGYKKIVSKK